MDHRGRTSIEVHWSAMSLIQLFVSSPIFESIRRWPDGDEFHRIDERNENIFFGLLSYRRQRKRWRLQANEAEFSAAPSRCTLTDES